MKRKDKDNYYLDIAETVMERSTCLRRKYGAIIVLNDEIIATGYNGAPRGRKNCDDMDFCARESLNIPSGERYELCRSVHAEANAIISAARRDMIGATLYLTGIEAKTGDYMEGTTPCTMCRRLIINAGISKVVCRTGKDVYTVTNVRDWVFNDDSMPAII
jgi:dCMP deaminase